MNSSSAAQNMLDRAFLQLDAAIEMDDPEAVKRFLDRIIQLMNFTDTSQISETFS
ncbi:MAG: hypothetical protein JJE30_14725 [Desulfuromonadales bacterium]|nr:hypothetical protein [Desulfuromonadales bacterium]